MAHTQPLPGRDESEGLALPAALALLAVLVHLPLLGRYGYHHDELYFLACGEHLAFGYVDHAPLVPWIARLATGCFGDSLFGLRILSVFAGAVTVFLTGLMVRRMGGGRFAQGLACVAMLIAPVYLRAGNLLCLPAFEPLFWALGFYFLIRIAGGGSPRLWLLVGVAAGCGLLNKHSMLLFGFGYGNAGAIDRFGRRYGLPAAVSLQHSYWIWGLPEGPIETAIGVGFDPEALTGLFEHVELAAEVELEHVNPWQTPFPVTIWREPKVSLREVWAANRPW